MLRNGLILMFAVHALSLAGVSSAAVSVFHNETCVAPYTACTPAAAATINVVTPATVTLTLFYQNSDGATASSDPNTRCLSGNGDETCGWDIHISSTSPTVILASFVPDTGPGSDIVHAITGNVLRMNGGVPTVGELGIRRLGVLHVTKASPAAAGSVNVTGHLSVNTVLAAVPVTSGNTLATATGGLDTDSDGVDDSIDNCPTVANGLAQAAVVNVGNQIDGTVLWAGSPAGSTTEASKPALTGGGAPPFGDGVGDACDNCRQARNPLVAVNFLTTNTWATLTGGQRDDDHDGYGNKCDGDFTAGGLFVGSGDTLQYSPSLGKNRTALTGCGSPATQRCARFDLDETGLFNGSGDTVVYSPLLGKAAGPRCPACTGTGSVPLPCTVGAAVPSGCSSVP